MINALVNVGFGTTALGRFDEESRMHPRTVQVESKVGAGSLIAVATLLVLGLAGCAAELGRKPNGSASEAAPYVGVFTGEFVDGKPLYRFPAIYVIGSRSSAGPDI